MDDSWKQVPKDDVYVGRYYRWPVYTVTEAIQCHRETHHPSMYNVPNAPLTVEIELNMQGEKATRFVDNFQRVAMIPHKFEHGEERKIIVFTKGNVSNYEKIRNSYFANTSFFRMKSQRLVKQALPLWVAWS